MSDDPEQERLRAHRRAAAATDREPSDRTSNDTAVPGKQTQPERHVCLEHPPRKPSLLDDLLPRDRADLERRVAAAIARDQELVIGALPLGGTFVGPRGSYHDAIAVDRAEIAMRTLRAHSSSFGALAGTILRLRGASDVVIMQGAEAAAVVEAIVGAAVAPRAAAPPRAADPAKRDPTLIADLKRRSVPTFLDGSPNPEFDPNTPGHIAAHFKREQGRTGSDSPYRWRNPEGYQAQHPNGRPFAIFGEPPGTRLHWGTIEDNSKLQAKREFGQTPTIRPKPLP